MDGQQKNPATCLPATVLIALSRALMMLLRLLASAQPVDLQAAPVRSETAAGVVAA
jgi:hypothetical protein